MTPVFVIRDVDRTMQRQSSSTHQLYDLSSKHAFFHILKKTRFVGDLLAG
jgi:hypothetical protein